MNYKTFLEELHILFTKDFSRPGINVVSTFLREISSPSSINLIEQDQSNYRFLLFLDSLVPPDSHRLIRYRALKDFVNEYFVNIDRNRLNTILDLLLQITDFMYGEKSSRSLTLETKENLFLFNRERNQRGFKNFCESCGYQFSDSNLSEGTLVDILKPNMFQSISRFRKIEIDHIYPHSKSGDTNIFNLQILCGFCNSAKSNRTNLFQLGSFYFREVNKSVTTTFTQQYKIPSNPLIFRMLYKQTCFKCHRGCSEVEMTIDFFSRSRQLTPDNIIVTCYECLKVDLQKITFRYITSAAYEKLIS